jgi:S-adenosyl methyltransferase
VTEPQPPPSPDRRAIPAEIDFDAARLARVRDFLAGGEANFEADRKAIEHAASDQPGGMDAARATVRSMGAFMARSVRYLATEHGVRQYLYIGAPIPTADDVHVVARRLAPESRIVYVGDDPVGLAHAHSLRKASGALGAADYVHGALTRLPQMLERSAATLDFTRPVAVLPLGTLAFVPEEDDPHGIVAELGAALPTGSFLIVAHTTDLYDGVVAACKRLSETLQMPFVVRTQPEIARFLDGLELVDPGLVQIDHWRPDPDNPPPDEPFPVPLVAALGRKA